MKASGWSAATFRNEMPHCAASRLVWLFLILTNILILWSYFSFPLDGKNKAVEIGAILSLVPLLCDRDADVRANASGAIMVYVTYS